MADAGSLVESARARGLRLFLAGGQVKVRAPKSLDSETKALIHELREHREDVRKVLASNDPVLIPDQWYPSFRDLHHKVVAETPNFDYGWLRTNRPDLYRAIKAKENELDALGEAKLSRVLAIMREWRKLILNGEFEWKEATKQVADERAIQ